MKTLTGRLFVSLLFGHDLLPGVVVVCLARGISFSVGNGGLAGIGYRTIAAFSVARKPTTASAQYKKAGRDALRPAAVRPDAGDLVNVH